MHSLAPAGITLDRLIFRVYIRESADADAAKRFWLSVTGAEPSQFRRTTLKRHNPNYRSQEHSRGLSRLPARRRPP
jgi:hypothetical protein